MYIFLLVFLHCKVTAILFHKSFKIMSPSLKADFFEKILHFH